MIRDATLRNELMPSETQNTSSYPRNISFLRKRDYQLVRELGEGACGKTVLLRDDVIDEYFVCKKFQPYDESVREELFSGFLREIKLLHGLHHRNVVRVFNYHLYPKELTGYILMEFVDGVDIQSHVEAHPEHADQLFIQAVSGFQYMEEAGVLHRDIRPLNLTVGASGELKIIDLGFGKRVSSSTDFDKSVSLNWWCETPQEFRDKKYDYKTEVYFVGKLFEKLIIENSFNEFGHTDILRRMCLANPHERISSFSEVAKAIRSEKFSEIEFVDKQREAYRIFADQLMASLERVEHGAKYIDDVSRMHRQLADAYRSFMLEEYVPDAATVTRCFIEGTYYYKKTSLPVFAVKGFLDLLRGCSPEQSRVVLANLQTKLDTVKRYSAEDVNFYDAPF